MLGGGTFLTQNKVMPGAYINFVGIANASANLSDRGIAAVPLVLDWGPEKEVFEVTNEAFQKDCQKIFGYSYDAAELRDLRELFLNATKGIFYRLNSGVKASNDFAQAKYSGIRGNNLSIAIEKNVDDENKFDVRTFLDGRLMDSQTVSGAADLQANDYVVFKSGASLAVTSGSPLVGGTNGTEITGADHSDFLAAIESRSFHILCCPATEEAVKALYAAYTKRLRDEVGMKFQTVLYRNPAADYEGVISVENEAAEKEQGLVYWVAGAEAGCAVNKTIENRTYNGEYAVKADYTQRQLSDGILAGKFLFHKVGDDIRVLMDINTLVTYTVEKTADFSNNQTIRVLDQIGNDIAALFNNRYLGIIPNDDAGRISFWNDLVTYGKKMQTLRAIEPINADEITVEKGETKRSVVVNCPIQPINCMGVLYMTVIVQ